MKNYIQSYKSTLKKDIKGFSDAYEKQIIKYPELYKRKKS